MKAIVKSNADPTVQQRNLLSATYQNKISSHRAFWRIVSSSEQKEESRVNETTVKVIRESKETVQEELSEICGAGPNFIRGAQTGESNMPLVLPIYFAVRTVLAFDCIFTGFLMWIVHAEQNY